jgi:hypothetical protein
MFETAMVDSLPLRLRNPEAAIHCSAHAGVIQSENSLVNLLAAAEASQASQIGDSRVSEVGEIGPSTGSYRTRPQYRTTCVRWTTW